MDVSNRLNKMRISPFLLAVLTASTAIGMSEAVNAQSLAITSLENVPATSPDATIAMPVMANPAIVAPEADHPDKPNRPVAANPSPQDGVAAPEQLSQTPPPGGTPGIPEQENPGQIRIETNPAPAGTPEIEPELQTPEVPPGTQPPDIPTTPVPTPDIAPTPTPQPEVPVQVSEVVVVGLEGNPEEARLQEVVYNAISIQLATQTSAVTTESQLLRDRNAIIATGLFQAVDLDLSKTVLGNRLTIQVVPNPILQQVQVQGTQVLPQEVVEQTFSPSYGRILNLVELQEGIKKINAWYQQNGYVLAQVVAAPRLQENGVVVLEIAEGVIQDIQVRFLNKEDEPVDEQGNPIRGRTRPFIVTRQFQLKPGDVFNRATAERDLQRVFGLGIFEDVKLSLDPGTDPRQVVVVANVTERNTGSVGAGAGFSSSTGLFGTLSYQEQNFGGNNQRLGGELQIGERNFLFDINFTDPWIAGDPFRTSYTVNAFSRRTISLIFDGGENEVELANGDRPRVTRTGGGVSFTRPLSPSPFTRSEWTASLGLQYQRVTIRDRDGDIFTEDELGNQLSFSDEGKDDLLTVQFGLVRDLRNNPLRPTQGSLLRIGTEQSIPIGLGNIFLNRLRASYSYYIPVQFTRFTEGPQALAFNIQAGTVLGDLPPYEAFSLGGSNSVRGYDEGDVGSGRSFIQATVEYRFPVFSVISGALFLDAATDLGSGDNVPGEPAEVRGKPGNGIGYGFGVRIQSPLGPIRIDYGFNDNGDSQLHFGFGERF